MDFIQETNTVVLFSKKYKLDALSKKIGSLSGQQIYEFFINRSVKIPRKLHVDALFSVLNLRIPQLKSNAFPKENFQRLQYYSSFSETNLLKLAKSLFFAEEFEMYRQNLMKLIIINYIGLNLNDGELQYLYNLKKTSLEDFDTYSNYISSMCYEQDNTFDGQEKELFFTNLEESTSVKSMQEIGEKYGIPIPSRLKKDEYIAYILDNLDTKNAAKHQDDLAKMTLKQLEDFADANNILMHQNMNKKENIMYFLYTIKQFQMPCTTLKRLETLDICEPIKFTVLIDKVNFFEKGAGENVIVVEGQETIEESAENETTEENVSDIEGNVTENAVSEETSEIVEPGDLQEESKEETAADDSVEITEPVEEQEESTNEEPIESLIEEPTIESVEDIVEEPALEAKQENTIEDIVEEPAVEEIQEETIVEEKIYEPDPETRIENDEFEAYVEVRVKKSKKDITPVEEPKEEIQEEPVKMVEEEPISLEVTKNEELTEVQEEPIVLDVTENEEVTEVQEEPIAEEEIEKVHQQEVDESKLDRVNSLYQVDLKERRKKRILLGLYITLGVILLAIVVWMIIIILN